MTDYFKNAKIVYVMNEKYNFYEIYKLSHTQTYIYVYNKTTI